MIGSLIGIIASSGAAAGGVPVSGYSLWLDASDTTTFSFSSGSRVSEWRDKSGNGYNFVQATSANQPDRSATQNSLSAVKMRVSGTRYFMTNTSLGDWSASAFTFFSVIDFNDGNFVAIIGRNSVGALQMGSNGSAVNFAISRIGQATSSSNLTPTASNADVAVYKSAGISSGSVSVDVYKNGTAGSSALTLTSLGSGNKNIIGASNDGLADDQFGNDGYICELILFPSQLNDTDRNQVEDYLIAKWGL
jgi:hypothetical protein